MKGRTPTTAEKRHMDQVQQLGCLVCRDHLETWTPAEIHHTDGKTRPGAHFRVIPLCFHHHRSGQDTHLFTSRHPYKKRFEQRYGTEAELLVRVAELVDAPDLQEHCQEIVAKVFTGEITDT